MILLIDDPQRSLQHPTAQNHGCDDDVPELIWRLGGITAATGVHWARRLTSCFLRYVRKWQCVKS